MTPTYIVNPVFKKNERFSAFRSPSTGHGLHLIGDGASPRYRALYDDSRLHGERNVNGHSMPDNRSGSQDPAGRGDARFFAMRGGYFS